MNPWIRLTAVSRSVQISTTRNNWRVANLSDHTAPATRTDKEPMSPELPFAVLAEGG
jgi:hypothetical protein